MQQSRDLDQSKRCEFSCKQVLEEIITLVSQEVENTVLDSLNMRNTQTNEEKMVLKCATRNKRVSAPKRMANPFRLSRT